LDAKKHKSSEASDPWSGLDGHRYDNPRNRKHSLCHIAATSQGRWVTVEWECSCGNTGNIAGLDWAGAAFALVNLVCMAIGEGFDI